ncbi:MAG: aminopeptidase P family protein [Treponema sp.]|jgi:Xaa-Pro aminopeptidase|nr:aminopeptidase P family protein [Treponema sp.]
MNAEKLKAMQEAIRGEGLDGWLFCNFRHRDKLADEILRINPGTTNSRLWVYAVPASGRPLGILHAIENDSLGDLPGDRVSYRSREEFLSCLEPLAGKRWGTHVSESITALSYLDAGTAAVFEKAGLIPMSAAGLLQRFKGLLDGRDIQAHEQAADHLYEIVKTAWAMVRESYGRKNRLFEGEIQELMLMEMKRRNLVTDHAPIVAAGANSGNPHYDLIGGGGLIKQDDVIQFDLWAKDSKIGGIYADISWVGVYGPRPRPEAEKAFAELVSAREGAWEYIRQELAAGRRPSGADVDRKAREILIGLGYEQAICHRTGHGIDTEVHGAGVNMDSVEFPDSRLLLDGACFSLEPGIYFSGFGMRTEIDVYIKDGKPVVSGQDRQFQLLTCG